MDSKSLMLMLVVVLAVVASVIVGIMASPSILSTGSLASSPIAPAPACVVELSALWSPSSGSSQIAAAPVEVNTSVIVLSNGKLVYEGAVPTTLSGCNSDFNLTVLGTSQPAKPVSFVTSGPGVYKVVFNLQSGNTSSVWSAN
jgi:hypothetical protein